MDLVSIIALLSILAIAIFIDRSFMETEINRIRSLDKPKNSYFPKGTFPAKD